MKKFFFKGLTGFILLTFLLTAFPLPVKADDSVGSIASKCLSKLGIEGLSDLLGLGGGTAQAGGLTAAQAASSIPTNDAASHILQGQQVGVTIGSGKAISVQTCVEAITQTLLKIAFERLKKRVFDMIVEQTVQWIQGGGKPQFVTDWWGSFRKARDVAIGDVVQQVGLGKLCTGISPPQLAIGIGLQAPEVRFQSNISCTLQDIVSNIEDFRRDFKQGGWIALNQMYLPQNNPYGVAINVDLEMDRRAAEKERVFNQESSGGFLSSKVCDEWQWQFSIDGWPVPEGMATYNPQNCDEENSSDKDRWCKADYKPDPKEPPPGHKDQKGSWVCTKSRIITPGQTIGALATKAVGSDLDFIINSQDLEAYISAIADAAISRLINEANRGLAKIIHRQAGTSDFDRAASDLQTEQRNFGNYRENLSTGSGGGAGGGGAGGGGAGGGGAGGGTGGSSGPRSYYSQYIDTINEASTSLQTALTNLNNASSVLSQAIASSSALMNCSSSPIIANRASIIYNSLLAYQNFVIQLLPQVISLQQTLIDDKQKLDTTTDPQELTTLFSSISQHHIEANTLKDSAQNALTQINLLVTQLSSLVCPP